MEPRNRFRGIDFASLWSLAVQYDKKGYRPYRPARLGIDSWVPQKVYKYGLWILPKECKPVLQGLSFVGNLVKPLMSLYGAEWRERGYGLLYNSIFCSVSLIVHSCHHHQHDHNLCQRHSLLCRKNICPLWTGFPAFVYFAPIADSAADFAYVSIYSFHLLIPLYGQKNVEEQMD
jgi:hypothetical protein